MEKIEFVRCGEPHGISSSPHWSYRSIPAGVKSDAYYRASDVDALLQAALALVEAVVEEHPYLENSPQGEKCPICQAIAAFEAIISPPRSSHPPADNGRA